MNALWISIIDYIIHLILLYISNRMLIYYIVYRKYSLMIQSNI